jgi:copper chaperone CopZ
MRYLIAMTLIAVALALPACKTTPTTDGDSTQLTTTELYAKGLSCPLCASNIDKTLKELPGVEYAKVDLSTGKVVVYHDPANPPSDEALARAVDDAGFTLDRIVRE